MKVVFMGTPEFAVPILKLLIDEYDVVGVVTQPDRMVGRKRIITPPPVKKLALEHNLKVFQPLKIKEDYQEILALAPDLIVTCAYGQILPEEILHFPKYGCINVHASLLPKLRGGAPIHHAIIDGYKETGITIMYMSKKMDQGDILTQVKTPILDDDTLGSLQYKLSEMAKDLLKSTIPLLIADKIIPLTQHEEEATYGYNISREEERIDFTKSMEEVNRQVRGLNPVPGAYTTLNGKILKIYDVRFGDRYYPNTEDGTIVDFHHDGFSVVCGKKELVITDMALEGKRRCAAKDFLNGVKKEELKGTVLR
ncbi:MAG: methionyl-tRNA formyltransferase [bacterium]|nr:methionyl-tRNA formyltransferase [bacterium]